MAFSQQGIAVVISSDKSRIEDSLQLSATIDLSDEIFLGTLDVQVLSPLNEIAIWNNATSSFNDLGLFIRIARLSPTPFKITVLRDAYNCVFGPTVISNKTNRNVFSSPEYVYTLRSSGTHFQNGQYQLGTESWQMVENDKYISDVDINIQLPQISSAVLNQLNMHEGRCSGHSIFILSLA